MTKYVTLKQRDARELARRQNAAAAIEDELRVYAHAYEGRFILYGSVARRSMHSRSDVDIIVDFPEGADRDAWDFAEEICAKHRMPADIQPRRWASKTLLERIAPDMLVLS